MFIVHQYSISISIGSVGSSCLMVDFFLLKIWLQDCTRARTHARKDTSVAPRLLSLAALDHHDVHVGDSDS